MSETPVEPAPFVMLPIPVEVAKDVAIAHGYDQVVIFARRVAVAEQPGGDHLTTYGRTAAHSDVAARVGYHLRTEVFHWQPTELFSRAAVDVLDERTRQKRVEGWTEEHDDGHERGELALAAALYALPYETVVAGENMIQQEAFILLDMTLDIVCGWELKPEPDRRRRMVKAAALLLAEVERIDRAAKSAETQP